MKEKTEIVQVEVLARLHEYQRARWELTVAQNSFSVIRDEMLAVLISTGLLQEGGTKDMSNKTFNDTNLDSIVDQLIIDLDTRGIELDLYSNKHGGQVVTSPPDTKGR